MSDSEVAAAIQEIIAAGYSLRQRLDVLIGALDGIEDDLKRLRKAAKAARPLMIAGPTTKGASDG